MADTPAELGEHEAEGATYPPLHAQVTEHNGDEDDDEDDDDEDDDVGNYDEDDDEALPEYDITLNGLSSYLHALELGIDLPTIDLTNQGIGDHGIIELLDKLQETNKLTSVCTLKLDGNDIEAEGARRLAECLKTNDTITFVDLKWNLISVEGTRYLAQALEHNTTLVSLNLDGNELGEEGAEVLAASLVRNRGLKYLELKDNIIGDAGAKALAQGLSGQTDMVLLDLTSNEIGIEGAKAIAHYLIGRQEDYPDQSPTEDNCYTLETLILNNNNISDEGSIALGKALLDNTTLRSLQLRKCGIHTEGVLGIAEALTTKNTTVTELDLNSNACGVRGEIALNDMMMSKPELYVEWKDASSESTWNIDEIQQIIQHYGVSDILSNILRGFSLVPLIENFKLLGALEIDDQAAADSFIAAALSDELLLNGLTMIVTILNQGEDEEDPYEDYVMEETQITVEELPPILRAIHTHLPSLHEKLTRPSTELMNIPGGAVRPLGEAKLKILQFITSLVKQNTTALTERIIELKLHNAILELMAAYPLNNILHFEIVRFVQAALHTRHLKLALVSPGGIIEFIVDQANDHWRRELSQRGGFSGHLENLAREIISIDVEGTEVHEILQANARWQEFLNNAYQAYKEETKWQEVPV